MSVLFRLRRPSVFGWTAVETGVSQTDAAVMIIALGDWQESYPDLIRSPRLFLAHAGGRGGW